MLLKYGLALPALFAIASCALPNVPNEGAPMGALNHASAEDAPNEPSGERPISQETAELLTDKISEIVESIALAEIQREFLFLLQKHGQTVSREKPAHRYDCAFLTHFGIEEPELTAKEIYANVSFFSENLADFAATFYQKMSDESPQQAEKVQEALERVLPQVYRKNRGKAYLVIIDAYCKSGLEPKDFGDFSKAIGKALLNDKLLVGLSHVQVPILRALQQWSRACRHFFLYAFKNYCLEEHPYEMTDACFWRSLLLTSFLDFARADRQQAEEVFNEIAAPDQLPATTQPEYPPLLEQYKILGTNLFTHRHASFSPVAYAARKGHTETVKYLVEVEGIDPKPETIVLMAARGGHLKTIKSFIKGNLERIPIYHQALGVAAKGGHINVVKYLVEVQDIRPNTLRGKDFNLVATNGYTDVLSYLARKVRETTALVGPPQKTT